MRLVKVECDWWGGVCAAVGTSPFNLFSGLGGRCQR